MRFVLFFLFPAVLFSQSDWTSLFNGKNLNGWKSLNGHAEYRAENEEIIGISAKDTPNTFLATENIYGDFILELEVKVDPMLNSGIQFRSNSLSGYMDGSVHGYQAEVDPSPRAYSGGIYDEARRGWLYPLTENEKGRQAFNRDDWNHYRIEAIGPEIRIWVNGVNTANLVDDVSLTGFIALQVHSISEDRQVGKKVRWRNIRIKTENLEAERKNIQPNAPEKNLIPNTLTTWEKENGWELLWDGKTFDGWDVSFCEIKNGALMSDTSLHTRLTMVSQEKYGQFELKVEFKFKAESESVSGIRYLVEGGAEGCKGLEFHIEKERRQDGLDFLHGTRSLGSLYLLVPPENHSEPARPPYQCLRWGEGWQTARIVVDGDSVEHWLNGFKLVAFDKSSQVFRALLEAAEASLFNLVQGPKKGMWC